MNSNPFPAHSRSHSRLPRLLAAVAVLSTSLLLSVSGAAIAAPVSGPPALTAGAVITSGATSGTTNFTSTTANTTFTSANPSVTTVGNYTTVTQVTNAGTASAPVFQNVAGLGAAGSYSGYSNYASSSPRSQWIGPQTASNFSFFRFDTVFTLASVSSLSGNILTDNSFWDIQVDGTSYWSNVTALNNGRVLNNNASGASFFLSGLSGGDHTLSFVMYNNDGPAGINFGATVTPAVSAVPESSAVVTVASMVGITGLGLLRGRRRTRAV